jgi:signal transduction histidine kinase
MTNHELRNALTAVHGWTELWIRKTAPDTPRAAIEVRESAERSLNLLEDLLDLSRLDAAKLEPVITDTDAWEIVREAVATVEPAAERRGVRVEVTGPAGTVPARTDRQRVRQILINLLTNAVRHSPSDEAIDVELQVRDGELRFDVVDRGEGIASEQQAVIFEAFERAGRETQRGTGLGLALSRKLARLLGGDLRVESRQGKGARFYLQLPRRLKPSPSS